MENQRTARVSRCRSCGANVIFAPTNSGKTMILDAVPVERGNVVIAESGRALVLGKTTPPPDTERYTSHHATCPDAVNWRRR